MTLSQHAALLRHFADLRDGVHGDAVTREDKETLFARTVELLDPLARRVLAELNTDLLLDTGTVAGSSRDDDGGLVAEWSLTWPAQTDARVGPVVIRAHYGRNFHHPHLGGATVGEWPLNVFSAEQAQTELPTLRAIAAADLHNRVFEASYRIVPATVEGRHAE